MGKIKYGAIKVEVLNESIRLHVGNSFRDLSATFARRISSMLRESAEKLEKKNAGEECNR